MIHFIALTLGLAFAVPTQTPRLFLARSGALNISLDATARPARAVLRFGAGDDAHEVRAIARATRDEVGRATDYRFEDRAWVLHVPDASVARGLAVGGPPRFIDPDSGRTELTEVIEVAAPPSPAGTEAPVRSPTAGNHSAAMIHFLLPDTAAVARELAVFEGEFTERRPSHFTFNEPLGDGRRREITMWTAREWAPHLGERVLETFGAPARIRRRLIDEEDHAREPETFASDATPLTYRVLAFGRDLDAFEAGVAPRAPIDAVACLREHLVETERLLKQVREVGRRLGAYSHSAIAKADLERDFEAPILALMKRGFAAIHALDLDRGVGELLHGWPEVFGFPQTYLARPVRSGNDTYFDRWVAAVRTALTRTPDFTADAAAHPRGIETYLALGAYSLRLDDHLGDGDQALTTWPVFALGLSIGDHARDELRRLVHDADRASERVRRAHAGVDGGAFVAHLLEAISTGAERSYRPNYANFTFRPAPYYARAAALFAELLEDARFTITNRATNLLILSNARRLILAIEEDYPRGARTGAYDEDDDVAPPDLDTQLSRLKNAFAIDQARLAQALAVECERALQAR